MCPAMWLECSERQRLVPISEANVAASLPSQSARRPVSGSRARKSRLMNDPALASGRLEWQRAQLAANTSRSEEHTSELQSLMRISYDVFCLKKKNIHEKLSREIY